MECCCPHPPSLLPNSVHQCDSLGHYPSRPQLASVKGVPRLDAQAPGRGGAPAVRCGAALCAAVRAAAVRCLATTIAAYIM